VRLFVTVGSMLPFDRLVLAMAAWTAAHPGAKVVAQVGQNGAAPAGMECRQLMSPQEFLSEVQAADVVVAHAGMGTVIAALEAEKPLVVLPRRPEAGEATSAHQIDTVRWLAAKPGIVVAEQVEDLAAAIDVAIQRRQGVAGLAAAGGGTRSALVAALRGFIQQG
jgi:UDP-N-acetylglucosamine transferase subunit ALG13